MPANIQEHNRFHHFPYNNSAVSHLSFYYIISLSFAYFKELDS